MPSDLTRKPPQRHRQRTRVVAVVVSGAFGLPLLFVFGVTLRELSRPPEPSIYAAPDAPPVPAAPPESVAPPESSADTTSATASPQDPSTDPLRSIPPLPDASGGPPAPDSGL